MGLSQSSEGGRTMDEEEEEEEEGGRPGERGVEKEGEAAAAAAGDVDELEQEPELLPSECSASPLSPQRSMVGSPPFGSTVRVWDPCNLLNPLQSTLNGGNSLKIRRMNQRVLSSSPVAADDFCTEVYLIQHGESNLNTHPDLITGRWPSAVLTTEGKRQARALGVFLLSQGVHFDAAFASPLERSKQTAISVCQELNFPREKIELADALTEMNQGQWEGLRCSEVYTAEVLNIRANSLPDFRAPEGESQRQVEFRMIEFLNSFILPQAVKRASMAKDVGADLKKMAKENGKSHSRMQVYPLAHDYETNMASMDLPWSTHKHLIAREARKSRLQIVTTAENTDRIVSHEKGKVDVSLTAASNVTRRKEERGNSKPDPFYVGVFSHGMAIKCLLRGLLGSDPHMTCRLCIDNTSVTVLRYSSLNGWQIQRVNDTAHLRLL